jgi:MFS family permease
MNLGIEYRRIWIGNAISNLADGIIFVAIPLLALTVTHRPLAIAGLDISYTVPRILAVLGIGVLIDRTDRRRLLYLASFAQAAVFAVLYVVQLAGAVSMPVLYLIFASIGLIETLADSSALLFSRRRLLLRTWTRRTPR